MYFRNYSYNHIKFSLYFYHREFDLREPHGCSSQTPCKNIIVNLKTRNKEVKCIQLHPLFPDLFAVGATDPLVRLYDRRKLSVTDINGSSQRENSQPCVSCFSPGHLYNHKKRGRPRRPKQYSTTYISFSPNGKELIQYSSGEHIFLYNIDEKMKPLLFESHGDCAIQSKNEHTEKDCDGNTIDSTYEMRKKILLDNKSHLKELYSQPTQASQLKQKGNDCFSKDNFFQAITHYNEALKISPQTSVLYANRAAALLRRKW